MSQVWLKVSAGGGITSQFIILLQNILFGSDKIPNGPLYVDKGDILKRLYTDYLKEDEQVFFNLPNWWDAIFDQKKDHTIDNYFNLDGVYRIPYNFFIDPIDVENLYEYRQIVKNKLKFHPSLLLEIENQIHQLEIDNNTLAVHLRLTDLNDVHSKELGKISLENYLKEINNILDIHPNINKIFIASESLENILYIQSQLSIPVVYVPNLRRATNKDNFLYDQVEYMKDPLYWREVFLDVFLLSKCKYLLGRISNVTNTSIILSDKIEKYYCINQILGYV